MEFKDKVAVVTGAGAGIGEGSAIAFGREGASVVVVDIDEEAGNRVVNEIEAAGGTAIFVKADVSNFDQVKQIAVGAVEAFGGIDVLHNNAGIQHYGTVVTTTEEEWDNVLAINLKSVFLCSKVCIPEMQKRGGGAIVNTSSVQAIASQQSVAPYSTTKAGILALTRSMALDFIKDNIRVNAICPASVDTPMLRAAADYFRPEDPNGAVKEWGELHPIGRVARPEEVAELILFLASPRASFVNGAAYLVDGGLMSKLF